MAEELSLQVGKAAQSETGAMKDESPTVDAVVSKPAGGSLPDAMIEQTETGRTTGSQPSRTGNELDAFVRRITKPHLVAAGNPRQVEALAMIDRALSAQMRALLHVPAFQILEAAWRAVYFLVRRIETSPQLSSTQSMSPKTNWPKICGPRRICDRAGLTGFWWSRVPERRAPSPGRSLLATSNLDQSEKTPNRWGG